MSNYKIYSNGVLRDMNDEEKAMRDKDTAKTKTQAQKKLEFIREKRNQKLSETDYLANSDVTMPDNIKTWRQNLRNLPQDNSTEEEYDLLLARDSEGKLTHTIWEKP
tara:strand:- start:216 stop:536 length:321 start_codon:yes stop_codon:yes gene_type:complete